MSAGFQFAGREQPWVARSLIGLAVVFLALVLLLPLATVFIEAMRNGPGEFFEALRDADALAALRLTLTVAAIAVPLNLVAGVAAAWAPSPAVPTPEKAKPAAATPPLSEAHGAPLSGRLAAPNTVK